DTGSARLLVGSCLSSPFIHPRLGDVRDLLLRAITEAWVRPTAVAPACFRFLSLNPALSDAVARCMAAWPKRLPLEDVAAPPGWAEISGDRLLRATLESATVANPGLERFVTTLRAGLLHGAQNGESVAEPMLALHCAVARQCFF